MFTISLDDVKKFFGTEDITTYDINLYIYYIMPANGKVNFLNECKEYFELEDIGDITFDDINNYIVIHTHIEEINKLRK